MEVARRDPAGPDRPGMPVVFDAAALDQLLQALAREGYEVLAPIARDGAVVYDRVEGAGELPVGWGDDQEAGHYRLRRREDAAYFGYNVGPQSWKRWLFPPRERLFSVRRSADADADFTVSPNASPPRKLAFVGMRACEVAAIRVQDAVFGGGAFKDPHYLTRREGVFMVAVNCTSAAKTCFCTSMGTGPRAGGTDLVMTEVVSAQEHYFLVSEASERGWAILGGLPWRAATPEQYAAASAQEARAEAEMGRKLDTDGLKEALAEAREHPRWDAIAERCLSCANCTMVCPTCFCSSMEDTVDVTGEHAERWRRWDSCFNGEFSELHGHPVRGTTSARYRHWMTHKLSTWHDQFASSGCVGCGRCIAWCPVAIDITEEAVALRTPPEP